jgi:YVTN family beta-propeller protein
MAPRRLVPITCLVAVVLLLALLVPLSLGHSPQRLAPPVPTGLAVGTTSSPSREVRAPDLPPTPGLVGPGPIRGYHFESTPLGIQYGDPTWFAYDGAAQSFYIAQSDSTVSVVPAGSIGLVAATIPVGSAPFGVAYDPADARVFVANSGSNNVSVISDLTNQTVASVAVGTTPYGIAYDNASGLLFVADGGSGTVTVVNASTLAVVANVTVGTEPVGVAYDPVSQDVFVGNEGSANVSVISSTTDTVVATVGAGLAPYGVAVDNATGEVYVSDSQSGDVTVIAPAGASVVTTLAVGGTPEGLTYDWRNQTVWVADGSAFVVVINASTNQIVQDIFFDPLGAAYDPDNGNVCFTNAANATFQCVVTSWYRYSELANLTFNETGLPPGTLWTVSVSGFFGTDGQISSNASTIVFQVFYAFGVDFTLVPLSGWSATPSSGATRYSGGGSFNITFTPAPGKYTITFLESGLVFNPWYWQYWGVNFSGVETDSPGLPIVAAATNGTYSYLGYPVPGYAAPTAALVTVQGRDVMVVIDYSSRAVYSVDFQEAGLPDGQAWGVTLNGTPAGSSLSSIGFTELNGTYPFSIAEVAGWTTTEFSGSLTVAGANLSVQVNWTEVTYPVVLTETGLPTGTSWSGTIDGVVESSYTLDLTFEEPNGTYRYQPGLVPGWTTAISGQTVVVNGGPVNQTIAWSEVVYPVVFTATNLTAGTSWEVTLGGNAAQGTTNSLSFSEPNGSYAFTIIPTIPYGATPTVGGVRVAGGPVTEAIMFFETPTPLPPLVTEFAYEVQAVCSGPVNVTFTSSVTGGTPPYTYVWNFSDGSPDSFQADPTHEFSEAYTSATVTLLVHDSAGLSASYSTQLQVIYPACAIHTPPPATNSTVSVVALAIVTVGVIVASAAVLLFVYRKRQA